MRIKLTRPQFIDGIFCDNRQTLEVDDTLGAVLTGNGSAVLATDEPAPETPAATEDPAPAV